MTTTAPTRTAASANLAEVRAMAHWLAAHDMPVFPLAVGAKTPATRNGFKDATTDPDRIAAWWAHTPHNIGLATGPAGLIVIDLDTPKGDSPVAPAWAREPGIHDGADVLAILAERAGAPLPFDTRTIATPSGGLHLYFTAPHTLPSTTRKLGPMVDTRACGGYVVTPPSRTPAGAYETINPAPIAPLPAWLADALTPPPPRTPTRPVAPRRVTDPYAYAAFENEIDAVLGARPGRRNDTLNRAAYALGRFVVTGALSHEHVTDALTIAAEHIGLCVTEAHRTIASGLRAGTRGRA